MGKDMTIEIQAPQALQSIRNLKCLEPNRKEPSTFVGFSVVSAKTFSPIGFLLVTHSCAMYHDHHETKRSEPKGFEECR